MALSMHTNYASLVTQNNLNRTNDLLNTSMERLSTGLRINSAADDAAGLQISNRLEMQNRGMSVAMRNAQDSISLLQTAEGAMDEMTNIAYRMNDLATQAANGTNTEADRTALNAEYQQLQSELVNIFENSNFGGRSLFAGSSVDSLTNTAATFQIGSTTSETLSVDISSQATKIGQTLEAGSWAAQAQGALDDLVVAQSGGGGLTGTYASYDELVKLEAAGDADAIADLAIADAWDETDAGFTYATTSDYGNTAIAAGTTLATAAASANGDISSQTNATSAMTTASSLIDDLGATRAQFGANINRLEHTITNLQNMSENLAASKGRITDADFAVESANMTKNQMLMQAGTQMLAQSKQLPGMAMSLLANHFSMMNTTL
ncbi:flagellin [Vibrio variabilis]|uniref:flagellin N-terminal helical domain-containing protein n=1 Tax=Vibrio variabilis TaxID=990271 RepID=UPI000DD6222B|nr:flagellin [Vibrio variabilis]